MIVHFFSNLVMLLPIILTGLKIHERHMTILPAIGVYREEEDAFLLVSWLSWFLPVALVIFSLIDIALIWAYIKFFHPWREIPQTKEIAKVNDRMCENEQQTEETEQTETEEGKKNLVVIYRCTNTSLATTRNSYQL